MKNRGILACAGAGKTYTICSDALSSSGRSLLITYTNKGRSSIESQLMKLNNEVPTQKAEVETWFGFLLRDIIRPYQSKYFSSNPDLPNKINFFQNIDFTTTYVRNNYKKETFHYFWSKGGMLKHNETVVFAELLFKLIGNRIINRLKQQYSTIYFDEVQDLTGTDMNIIMHLIDSPINVVMVGDPKQFTYRTHEEHRKNEKISGRNIDAFFKLLEKENKLEIGYTQTTRRFGKKLATFANSIDPEGELLKGSDKVSRNEHEGIFILSWKNLQAYEEKYRPTYLTYDSKQANKLPSYCTRKINFGDSKGITRDDIVILPNTPLEKFVFEKPLKSPTKYYIACTRARYSIALITNTPDKYKKFHADWNVWEP